MYKLNFNHLHYFLTIAKEGSIVKASKKLNITQPALSHQLKLLELDLGKKLFDRKGRRLILNKDGEMVRDYASKIFRNTEEMIHFLKNSSKKNFKIIKIGNVPWIPANKVYKFLMPFIANQHIKIEVYEKDLDTLIKDIQNSRLDIIICDSPYAGRSKKLIGHKLDAEKLVAVSSIKTKLNTPFPRCLNNKKVVTYSEASIIADKIDHFLMSEKLEVDIVAEFSDIYLARFAAEKGGVIAFLPESIAKDAIKEKRLKKLGTLKNHLASTWAITRKDYKTDSIISSILEQIKKP